ncbi:MAG: fructosamine kinase family protein [Thiohalomonadales bacterium]
MDKMWQIIEQSISDAVRISFTIKKQSSVSGGCINRAFKVQDENYDYFVKLNDVDLLDMFEAEFEGLSEIAQSKTIAVPKPICSGLAAGFAFIVLENLSFGSSDQAGFAMLGKQLAKMHRTQQVQFGWTRDNTIGSSTQVNSQSQNWLEFWQTQRLGYQLDLAGQNGYGGSLQKKGDKLMEKMSGLFPDGNPKSSLLHGDLWSGNMAILQSGTPVIFDPAVYYGDRETDIAMTELFGGFSENFYLSYNEYYPLESGYSTRKIFYNTYHILNHLNLFGGGYGQQAESMMDKVLSELG